MKAVGKFLLFLPIFVWGQDRSRRKLGAGTRSPKGGKSNKNQYWEPPTYPSAKSPIVTPGPTNLPTQAPTRRPTLLPVAVSPSDDRVGGPNGSPKGIPGLPKQSPPSLSPFPAPIATIPPTATPTITSSTGTPTNNIPVAQPVLSTIPIPVPSNMPIPTSIPVPDPTVAPVPQPSDTTNLNELMACGDAFLEVVWQGLGPPFTSDETFMDPLSYQCRALRRLQQQIGYQQFSFQESMKYWILYCIYFATSGSNEGDNIFAARQTLGTTWKNTAGWLETNVNPCDSWFGVKCDVEGRVTEIRLQRNGLTGTFPREVAYLASNGLRATGAGHLERLELHHNPELTNDPLDPWISELGDALRILHYGSTGFQGPLPDLPRNLVEFDASYTNQIGPLPDSNLQQLGELRTLILDGINYGSTIPSSIALIPNLEFFYIREANVAGDLSYMRGMPAIVEHLVEGNTRLSGKLFSFLGELSTLKSFSVADCSLTGSIPSEFGNVQGLLHLWLRGNPLTGPIPSELALLPDLRILALEDLEVTGEVPLEVCLRRFSELVTLSTDCYGEVDCSGFFPNCCSCCGGDACGTS